MIAMQYSFVLLADYDMAIIDRRIRDKGPLLDGFPRPAHSYALHRCQKASTMSSSSRAMSCGGRARPAPTGRLSTSPDKSPTTRRPMPRATEQILNK
jgi:hypothetical protein